MVNIVHSTGTPIGLLQRSGKSARTIKKVALYTKFGQLVLWKKIIEIVATRCHIL